MDPDANLLAQRRLVAFLLRAADSGERNTDVDDAAFRLAELVQALDEWLTGGGFLPPSWGKHWRGVRS